MLEFVAKLSLLSMVMQKRNGQLEKEANELRSENSMLSESANMSRMAAANAEEVCLNQSFADERAWIDKVLTLACMVIAYRSKVLSVPYWSLKSKRISSKAHFLFLSKYHWH